MTDTNPATSKYGVDRYIKRSRKKITVLFTDIEDSTKYWETHGDIQGRLMVDLHNRLTFPVIKKFKGTIIKTIGDSIMASFAKPENAVKAAMGMQQILEKARQADQTFTLRIRIGIHTGVALVEKTDVFGDVVNTAARVESEAEGNEVLMSEATSREVEDFTFDLEQAGRFKPKGKADLLTVYRIPWRDFESIIDDIKPGSYIPIGVKDKVRLTTYSVASVLLFGFLYTRYFRYFLASTQEIALAALNPQRWLFENPVTTGLVLGIPFLALCFWLWRAHAAPLLVLRTVHGAFGFTVSFLVCSVGFSMIWSGEPLYSSRHLFVDIHVSDAIIRDKPHHSAAELYRPTKHDAAVQLGYKKRKGVLWHKVYIREDLVGWVDSKRPPKLGIPEEIVARADKFYFRTSDLVALIVGLAGLAWGLLNFRIRPV